MTVTKFPEHLQIKSCLLLYPLCLNLFILLKKEFNPFLKFVINCRESPLNPWSRSNPVAVWIKGNLCKAPQDLASQRIKFIYCINIIAEKFNPYCVIT